MRFALTFVAILVVSWASHGKSAKFRGSTGAAKSVKELVAVYESSRIVVAKPDKNDEVITATGQKTSIKELITIYESFLKSETLLKSAQADSVPTVKQVETAIQTGKKFSLDSVVCKIGSALASIKTTAVKWFSYLCF